MNHPPNRAAARGSAVIESDVCIIGSGITAALLAERLTEERDVRVVVVEAGDAPIPLARRHAHRQRYLDYGENPWPRDHVDGLEVDGMQSRSMCVGGLAMHWGGVTPRFSPEDFRLRSLYGVGDDWPLTYEDLEPDYLDAEVRMGVAGEEGPPELDPRSAPYPLPPLPLSYNLRQLHTWADRAGIAFWTQPSAKNSVAYRGRPVCCRNDTCSPICPTGAKYTPDVTWNALTAGGKVDLVTRTVVRRLVAAAGSNKIERAVAMDRDDPDRDLEFRATTFIVAAGYVWSSHLLLLSTSSRFPTGLANRSGLVGKYLSGHRSVSAHLELPLELYPGINVHHSLVSKQFMRPGPLPRYMRHDLRIWESTFGREPRLRNAQGQVQLGDAILADWRDRTRRGAARVRAYYDVLPARGSELTLDPTRKTPWGDPLPRLAFRDSEISRTLRRETETEIHALFQRMARVGDGTILWSGVNEFQDHPAGGCRMGNDADTSVCDSSGRTHDHENLFVVGAPTMVTGGCANGTLTFVALGLRAAREIGRAFPTRKAR